MVDPGNRIIDLLPRPHRQRLMAACEPRELVHAELLCEHGEALRHVYFPIDGSIAMVSQIDAHPGTEVGLIGREGLFGAFLALGVVASPLRAVVQGAGSAWRLGSAAFRRELSHSAPLRRSVDAYLYVLLEQMATAVACRRVHPIAPRLARWLLMNQDRSGSSRLHVTQGFLAYMLGVRRVGITEAAGALQRDGLIVYRRGEVEVLDRSGLEAAACSCYAADLRAYALRCGQGP